MANIPSAEISPRIASGVIKWYQGDTFDIDLKINLTDQDGDPVTIGASDTVKVLFLDCCGNTVKEFTCTNIQNNTITLDFDATCTALFGKGNYTYDVYLNADERTTIVNDNKAVVE